MALEFREGATFPWRQKTLNMELRLENKEAPSMCPVDTWSMFIDKQTWTDKNSFIWYKTRLSSNSSIGTFYLRWAVTGRWLGEPRGSDWVASPLACFAEAQLAFQYVPPVKTSSLKKKKKIEKSAFAPCLVQSFEQILSTRQMQGNKSSPRARWVN